MNYKHFSVEEREIIQSMHWQKRSIRSIANALGRSPSSVCREMKRNFPKEHKVYTPRLAEERAREKRKCRGRKDRLKNEILRSYVVTHLKLGWSPEQISGCIKSDTGFTISHEAIYQYVYAQVHRGGYGFVKPGCEDLRIYLRRKQRRRRHKGLRRSQRVFRPRGTSIELRPKIVGERSRIGDWEGDTVESCHHKPGVNTLLERKTGYFLVTKVKNKTSDATVVAIEKRMEILPKEVKLTITFDNGVENSDYQSLEEKTGLKTFFAHPYSSHERAANENANGLLREYFPKGTDFATISDEEISRVEYLLNTRPRKRLGWKTPLQAMSVALQG
jgi:transposase, IS30 family